jgi:hypothetical protein
MKKLAAFAAVTIAFLVGDYLPACAEDETLDYTNSMFQCDGDVVANEVKALVTNGPPGKQGVQVLYLKDQQEVSRTKDKLVCTATLVLNVPALNGTYTVELFNQDGRALTHLIPGGVGKKNKR